MARALKSIFARHADKRGIARRTQDGRFISQGTLATTKPGGIRIDLDARHTVFFDTNNGKTRSYIRGGSLSQSKLGKQPDDQAFQNDVFASEAEYDQSVASVIARIKSGEVRPIEPDAE